ncbi:unnamed protein product [Peniophora sp. CBMAI 1063]|nr:unnamed protein product [Peniophora sp. CBMAI 1063]
MSCEHCIQGVHHEGTPEGTYTDIAGVKCYVVTPSGEYDKTKVVLYFCDAFGFELVNNRLLADDFARNGYKTIVTDFFEGEPAPENLFEDPELRAKFDFMAWLGRHSPAHNLPRIKGVINALKAEGVTRFGATGYCYGGKMIFDLVYDGELDVGATSHPSLLSIQDLEKFSSRGSIPLLINSCEIDEQFGSEKQEKAKELFKEYKAGFSMPYFEGCTHGFAVRGDMSDPKVKAGKEGSFKNTVEWFRKYLPVSYTGDLPVRTYVTALSCGGRIVSKPMVDITTSTYEHLWGNWAIGLVSICVLYYDWLLCLGDEIELIWLRGKRLSAASTLCRNMQFVHFIATAFIQVTTGVVFVLRVHAIYQNRLVLGAVMFVAAAALVMAIWAIVTSFTVHHSPDIYILGMAGCNPVMRKQEAMRFAISWAGLSIFDLTVFLLTAYKAVRAHGKTLSRLWYIFMRDGAAYFVIIFLANLGNIVCFLIAPPVLKGVTGLLTNVLSATLVSRLILNLRAASDTRSAATDVATSNHELQIISPTSPTSTRELLFAHDKCELDVECYQPHVRLPTPIAY